MASLTGQLVAETYKALLKLIDNDILTASEKQITDGFGGGSNVFIDSQGFLRANKYKITNGLATQFLKADGSLDSNAYLTSITGAQVITALGYTPVPTTRTITINGETHNLAADNSWTVGGTSAIWGNITGTLSNQTDLQNALNAKYNNPTGTISQYIRGDGSIANFPALTGYVPYSGATSNVNLGEYGITSGFVGFDTTPTGTPTGIGTLYWDSANRTLSLIDGDGDTTLQIGQEERVLVHNNTGATLTDGQIVYVTGSTGELPSVALASNSAEATSSVTFGMVTESIAHGADGFITTSGIVHGLNTLAFTEGAALWLGTTPGTFTQTKPVAPLNSVLIGYVIKKAGGNGSVFVKIQNGYELEELHDVYIADPANNHGIFYDIADGLWKNKSIATALGYTPQAQLSGTGFVKASGTTITYDNSTYLTTTDAASTYQRLDKMVSNLLPSATEYPNSNAVIAALALKADAANPVFTGNMTISGAEPKLYFTDTDQNPDYFIGVDAGFFRVYDQTAGATRFVINSDGNISTGVGKSITAGSFIKDGGTATQFLKADGSVDSNAYITSSALGAYLPLAGGTMTGTLNINGLGYGSTLVITTNSVNGADITLNNTGTGGKRWNITSTGTSNAMGAGSLQFYNETNQQMVMALSTSRNLLVNSTTDSGQRVQINGFDVVPLKLEATNNFSGTEYYRGGSILGFIGTENTTEGLRYNSIQGAFQHRFYSNSVLAATISNAGAIFVAGITANNTSVINGDLTINKGLFEGFSFAVSQNSTFAFGSTNGRRTAIINYTDGDRPGLQFGYDATANTGIIAGSTQSTGAGLDFYTYNGSSWGNRVRITKEGRVGIGQEVPDSQLHINSSIQQLKLSGNSNSLGIYSWNGGVNLFSNENLYFGRDSAVNNKFYFQNSSASATTMFINTATERVMIGTTVDAGYKLDVNGSFRIQGSNPSITTDSSTDYTIVNARKNGTRTWQVDSVSGAFWLYMQDVSSYVMQISGSETKISNNIYMAKGTDPRIYSGSGVGLNIDGDALYLNRYSMSNIVMTPNGGNVLISTTSGNGYKLQINGNTWSNGVRIGRDFSIANRATVRIDSRPGDNPADILFGRDDAATQTSWSGVYWSISSRGSGEGNEFRIYRGVANTGGTEIVAMNINPSAGAVTFINTVTATAFFESSDIRLKTLIESNPIIDGIEKLEAKLYKKNGKIELGYFAQDAELIMPYAVTKNADGFLNLSYREVHTAKIARLEQRVAELEKQLNLN